MSSYIKTKNIFRGVSIKDRNNQTMNINTFLSKKYLVTLAATSTLFLGTLAYALVSPTTNSASVTS